ncbi:MAG: lamin tail domain-containing protein [Candidatus Aenigmatarchaeota archaeon]
MQLKGTTTLDEWVEISSGIETDFTDWKLKDTPNHTYIFSSFILNDSVRIHTGSGTNNATDLYWGRGAAIWNDPPAGDTAYLIDNQDSILDQKFCNAATGQCTWDS